MSVQEAVPVQITRYSFTVAEYQRMGQVGIFSEDDRVELVNGEIVRMSPIGEPHASCVARLTQTLILMLRRTAIVWAQNPIVLDDYSEPQPDLAVLRPRADFYGQAHPRPEDVLIVIEVSDTTLEYDRKVKVPLYARAGIPETWVVSLPEECVEVYGDPAGGEYQTFRSYKRGRRLQSHTLAPLRLSVSKVLG
ncbi:MAG TPA: Uma2 family endonuclease [Pyrinomonadaceae bacterium]|nr:Uma2 family endonuclease [Pyrinomonadaceae bacterium]